MMKEHKHAEVLRAIADGKTVQYREHGNDGYVDYTIEQVYVQPLSVFRNDYEWRVKPEPKPNYIEDIGWKHDDDRYDDIFFASCLPWVKPKAIIRVLVDGESGLPKSVELIK